MNVIALKKDLIEIGRRLYAKDHIVNGEGNLSIKLADDRFLATASGVHKGFLTTEDIVVCDLEGNLIEGIKNTLETIQDMNATFQHLQVIGKASRNRGKSKVNKLFQHLLEVQAIGSRDRRTGHGN